MKLNGHPVSTPGVETSLFTLILALPASHLPAPYVVRTYYICFCSFQEPALHQYNCPFIYEITAF